MLGHEHSITGVSRIVPASGWGPRVSGRAPSPPGTDDAHAPELYQHIYVTLDLPRANHPMVIGVTSAISGEGRTTIALGLAQTLAFDLDVPIMLVEVDLERPSLATRFDIPPDPGLCEVLRGECRLDEVTRPIAENLSVVTTGAVGRDSARLLRQLASHDPFHPPQAPSAVLILDLPPLLNHGYSRIVAGVADAIVLVVRAGVTPLGVVREALALLEDRPTAGVVFNGPRSSLPSWWPGRGT